MRVVIPIGRGRPNTLPHVVRSLAANAGITEVVTVGETPKGIEPDVHIESPNSGKPYENVAGHLRRACVNYDDPFIWCDDDTFTVKPWTPAVYVRGYSIAGMLRKYPSRGVWSVAVRNSIKVMEGWGYDPERVPCGTIHRPWLIEPARTLRTIDALQVVGGGSFKALYVAGLDGVVEAPDPKIHGRKPVNPDHDVVSVFHTSWKTNAGRTIRDQFGEPSRWEPDQTVGKVRSQGVRRAAGHRRHRAR